MNYTEYALSEVMIEMLRRGQLSTKLTEGLLETKQIVISARLDAIKKSIKLLKSEDDKILADQCIDAITEFKKILHKTNLVEQDLTQLLEFVDAIERAENRCKEIIAEDWNYNLTNLDDVVTELKNFKLIVRAVNSTGYKNEMKYPIISTSLLTHDKMETYQKKYRTVSLIYKMDPKYLIAMSTQDSNTCEYKQNFLEFPFYSGLCSVTSTFGSNDYLKKFREYYNECLDVLKSNKDEYGEIVFNSTIEPVGVLLHERVSSRDAQWGRSYASVYDLPVFEIARAEDYALILRRI